MLLNLLQGNLPRVERVVRMTTSDCHRSESWPAAKRRSTSTATCGEPCWTPATSRLVKVRRTSQSTKLTKP
eukprot:1108427-Pyramimonas_sp.AAC.1